MAKWNELMEEERTAIEYPRVGAEQHFATGEYSFCWGHDFDKREAYYVSESGTRVITFEEAYELPDDEQKVWVRFIAERGQFCVSVLGED